MTYAIDASVPVERSHSHWIAPTLNAAIAAGELPRQLTW